MSSGGIPVIKFLFREDFRVLNEALSIRTVYEVEEFDAANDLATYLSTIPAGLVIISLRDKSDLVQVATLMKIIKKVAYSTAVKIVIINFSGETIYENAIAKLGIQDSIDTHINTKALKFKIDFWMKSLKGQIKHLPGQAAQKTAKESGKEADKKSDLLLAPQWEEALKLEDDIWILKSDNDCKKVLSKYLIRMLGPGPGVGQWIEIRHGLWRFDIVEQEKELYISGRGAWFFAGEQKPEFVWKESTWMMTGHNFELFYKDGPNLYTRLKFKNKILEIAKNSVFAKMKETIIIESFDKDLVFKKEAQSLEDLKGKNKTDKINGDPLSGDVESTEKESGNLSGKMNADEALSNYWANKLSFQEAKKKNDLSVTTDHLDSENLERQRKDQKHQKFYKNHNESENYAGENSEGARSDNEHQTHYKGSVKTKSASEKSPAERNKNVSIDTIDEASSGRLDKTRKAASKYEKGLEDFEPESEEADSESDTFREKKIKESSTKNSETRTKKPENSGKQSEYPADEEAFYKGKLQKQQVSESGREYSGPATSDIGKAIDLDKLAEGFKQGKPQKPAARVQSDVLPFLTLAQEKELDDLTEDAKVISHIILDDSKVACTLDDYFDDTVIFHTDDKNFKVPAEVKLDLIYKTTVSETILKIEGNVITIDSDGEGDSFITIQISPNQASELSSFMQNFAKRQQNINLFMKKVKGH